MRVRWRWNRWTGVLVSALVGVCLIAVLRHDPARELDLWVVAREWPCPMTIFLVMGWYGGRTAEEYGGKPK
jgi:hypothetical protein